MTPSREPKLLYPSASFEAALDEDARTPMYPHQLREYEERSHFDASMLRWSTRTGKSKATIDCAFRAAARGELDQLLIFAPNGPHANFVRRELPEHAWSSVPYRAMAWSTALGSRKRPSNRYASRRAREEAEQWQAQFDAMLRCDDFKVFTVNQESAFLPQVEDQLKRFVAAAKAGARMGVVFDECQAYRRVSSKWTKTARRYSRFSRWIRLLSATPWLENPLHCYSIFSLLTAREKHSLGFTRQEDFEDTFAVFEENERYDNGRQYRVLKHYKNLDHLGELVSPWISDVERPPEMSPVIVRRVETEMSYAQARAYLQLRDDFRLELEEHGLLHDPVQAGARFTRLQQVLSGFTRDAEGRTVWIDVDAPRLRTAIEEAMMTDGPAIVWCAFREEVERLSEILTEMGGRPYQYYGGTNEADRATVRDVFHPSDPTPLTRGDVLFATASSGAGSGLNLSKAGKIVWCGHAKEAIIRHQAMERCSAMFGRTIEAIDVVCPDTLDETILDEMLPSKERRSEEVRSSALDLQNALRKGDSWVRRQ